MTVQIRICKKEGEKVQIVPEGVPGATVLAIKRVNELDFYSLGLNDLAAKLNLGPNKTLALIWRMKLQDSEDFFKVMKVGKTEFKRYSAKALDTLKQALPDSDMDAVWSEYRAAQSHRKRRPKT